MLDSDSTDNSSSAGPAPETGAAPAPRKRAPRKSAAKKAAPAAETAPTGDAAPAGAPAGDAPATAAPAPRKRAPRKAAAKKAAEPAAATGESVAPGTAPAVEAAPAPAKKTAAKKTPTRRATKKAIEAVAVVEAPGPDAPAPTSAEAAEAPALKPARKRAARKTAAKAAESAADAPAEADSGAPGVLFMPPAAEAEKPRRRRPAKKAAAQVPAEPEPGEADIAVAEDVEDETAEPEDVRETAAEQATGARRRRRRGRRGRGGAKGDADSGDDADETDETEAEGDSTAGAEDAEDADGEGATRRRRRRRRSGTSEDGAPDDPANTVTHVREPAAERRGSDDGVKGVKGSTRLEAKRQRRRDGRETTRRRAPILTEAEFLARREAVDRVMAVRQTGERTQIAVLEDDVLVEHYVTRASAVSYVGNVYLGRVQNVLPSMEAAFVDIGKGRNGVLYAGEVNWDAAGLEGKSRAIENALKSGDIVLVQVTKDPIGHKGARLTSQVSLPGRFLVYVPGGGMTGISRRLPDTERHRLKAILKKIVPEDGGVIVRTAAEGASEEDLTRDVERLTAQWATIQERAEKAKQGKQSSSPSLVHGEPDLATRVVRDVFNEDFKSLIVQGDRAWETVSEYVEGVAPDLADRLSRHVKNSDLFADLRVDEQLMKALDRKVWLPSGGSLVIDRTEAMTVIDVNTGKFVGAGGNLEQTVTRNNIEAAEEIVRQMRLRDIGGIVVIDFIDMVLESNRELVLRRLTECLGRDRTKHQVAEVTSLGLVQMTRKRIGEGLLEAFSETCEHCKGRGVIISTEPVERANGGGGSGPAEEERPAGKTRRKRGGRAAANAPAEAETEPPATDEQRRAASAAIAAIHRAAAGEDGEDSDHEGGDGEHFRNLDALASGLVAAAMAGSTAERDEARGEIETANGAGRAVTAADDAGFGRAPEPSSPAANGREPNGAEPAINGAEPATPAPRRRRRAASRPAGPPTTG